MMDDESLLYIERELKSTDKTFYVTVTGKDQEYNDFCRGFEVSDEEEFVELVEKEAAQTSFLLELEFMIESPTHRPLCWKLDFVPESENDTSVRNQQPAGKHNSQHGGGEE